MRIHCPDCRAQYEVHVPPSRNPVKVRCPRCKVIFPVGGPDRAEGSAMAATLTAPDGEPAAAGEAPDSGDAPDSGEAPVAPLTPRPLVTDPALARRMARAMLSELVLNRRQERESAVQDGRLLARFGEAILGAHRVYAAKVSPSLPDREGIFREAVNEIVGGSRTIL